MVSFVVNAHVNMPRDMAWEPTTVYTFFDQRTGYGGSAFVILSARFLVRFVTCIFSLPLAFRDLEG